MTRRAASLCLLALAVGCAPKAQLAVAPQVLSTEWRGGPATGAGRLVAVSEQGLGEAFRSSELEALTIRALAANADIAIARTRIEQARAQLQIARAAMLPVVSASAGLSANRTDNRGGSPFDFSDAFAGLDVSFETDLFGGRRAERRAARDRLAAAGFDRDGTALVVEAEVARAYVQHSALADRLAFLDDNLAGAREVERIVQVPPRG